MADEMDSMLLSLIEKEIPDGRNALIDSHKNLAVLSEYCKENYINSPDKSKALDETKSYASQSLSSVAYQIHSLAVNMLQLMDQQHIQLQNMQSTANNIGLQVDIHKEKVARREIGVLTSSKNFSRSHKIVPPAQQEKPHKYKREEIDYSVLDTIGHGVKTDRNHDYQRRQSTSSSSGSLKAQSVSSVHSSSQGSLHSVSQTSQSTNDSKRHLSSAPAPPRPPVAPMAPSKPKTSVTSMSPQNVPSNPPPPPPPPAAPDSNMPPPPMFMPTPDYEGELDALLQSLENISFDIQSPRIPFDLGPSTQVPTPPPLPNLSQPQKNASVPTPPPPPPEPTCFSIPTVTPQLPAASVSPQSTSVPPPPPPPPPPVFANNIPPPPPPPPLAANNIPTPPPLPSSAYIHVPNAPPIPTSLLCGIPNAPPPPPPPPLPSTIQPPSTLPLPPRLSLDLDFPSPDALPISVSSPNDLPPPFALPSPLGTLCSSPNDLPPPFALPSPLGTPEDLFPPPLPSPGFDSPRSVPLPPPVKVQRTGLNFPEPPLPDLMNLPPPVFTVINTHQLPPPPPDMDDLYQIPTNNALADDLPPPPPDSFDEPLPPPAPMEPPNEIGEKVIAIYDYQKLRDDELELTEGDVLFVIKKNDDGWFEGIKDGLQGLFPGNYVTPYM